MNRDTKSVILGLGEWKGRSDWPLPWVLTVDKHKVFGITLTANYRELLKINWEDQMGKLTRTMAAWAPRVLDNIRARAEALRVFALSKVWYKAQIIPLPKDVERRISEQIAAFLWRGQITRNVLGKATVALPVKRGGLNLPTVGLRCEVLRVRHLVRMMLSSRTKKHLNFWLGKSLDCEVLEEEWYVMRRGVGRGAKPVVITSPYFERWAALFKRARNKGVLDMDELDAVTTKQMYEKWIDLEREPEIVLEEVGKPWGTIWTRVAMG